MIPTKSLQFKDIILDCIFIIDRSINTENY